MLRTIKLLLKKTKNSKKRNVRPSVAMQPSHVLKKSTLLQSMTIPTSFRLNYKTIRILNSLLKKIFFQKQQLL